jgi:hypothetical protein
VSGEQSVSGYPPVEFRIRFLQQKSAAGSMGRARLMLDEKRAALAAAPSWSVFTRQDRYGVE